MKEIELSTVDKKSIKEIAKYIKDSVKWLIKQDCGCCHFLLSGATTEIAVCVGWSNGYSEEKDDTIIQSKSEPTWAINARLGLATSYMKTDLDEDFPMPYWNDSGDCWDTSCTIQPDEDYESIAEYLYKEFLSMCKYQINDDGEIVGLRAVTEIQDTLDDVWAFDELETLEDKFAELKENPDVTEDTLNELQSALTERRNELIQSEFEDIYYEILNEVLDEEEYAYVKNEIDNSHQSDEKKAELYKFLDEHKEFDEEE